jgi:hypothetical protein
VRRALYYTCTRVADNEYAEDTTQTRCGGSLRRKAIFRQLDLEGEIRLTQGNGVMDNRVYDATLNNFSRLSISAALASPITK